MRYAAVDVHYPAAGGARAALIVADDQAFANVVEERVVTLPSAEPYVPGQFAARELPAVLAVASPDLDLLIVDGYVQLDAHGRPGLGAHVHDALGIPVIGVAKTAFRGATHAEQVIRGTATRPLLVTAAGMTVDEAAAFVAAMTGPFRLPDALRRVDALARGAQPRG